jgi:hypothetical protein
MTAQAQKAFLVLICEVGPIRQSVGDKSPIRSLTGERTPLVCIGAFSDKWLLAVHW